MTEVKERTCFTVGVFQDADWAQRGLDALKRQGFEVGALSILAKATPDATELLRKTLGVDAAPLDIGGLGAAVAHGSLVGTLQGADEGLGKTGIAATMRRAGFQAHDGYIFETLTSRGGVLIAIEDEPRAADALTILHAYGGGNAAIGAWTGRV